MNNLLPKLCHSFQEWYKLPNKIQTNSKLNPIFTSSLYVAAGTVLGTTAIASATVIPSFVLYAACITSLALIALGIKNMRGDLKKANALSIKEASSPSRKIYDFKGLGKTPPEKTKECDKICDRVTASAPSSEICAFKGLASLPPETNLIDELLPEEILLAIFHFLPPNMTAPLSLVSKKWKVISEDNDLWRFYLGKPRSFMEISAKKEYHLGTQLPALVYPEKRKLAYLRKPVVNPLGVFNNKRNKECDYTKAVSPDKKTFVMNSYQTPRYIDGRPIVNNWWSILSFHSSSQSSPVLKRSPISIDKLYYSIDGTKIIGVGNDINPSYKPHPMIAIWDSKTGEVLKQVYTCIFKENVSVKSLPYELVIIQNHIVAPNGNKILLWNEEVWDKDSDSSYSVLRAPAKLCIYDITKEEINLDLFEKEIFSLKTAAFSYDGTKIAIALASRENEEDFKIVIWDLESNNKLKEFTVQAAITSMAFSQKGDTIALVGMRHNQNGYLFLIDIESDEILEFEDDIFLCDAPTSIKFLMGDTMAIVSFESLFTRHILWDLQLSKSIHSFEGQLWTYIPEDTL